MSGILKKIKNAANALTRELRKSFFNMDFIKRAVYTEYRKHSRIKKNTILYMAYYGRGCICNPYAIFLEVVNNPEYKNYKHIWVIENMEDNSQEIQFVKSHSNVKVINSTKLSYFKWLSKAEYLISNVSLPVYYSKKPGQIYINTWHGIPIKTLGYDIPDGKITVNNIVKNYMMTDYLLSANDFTTHIYKDVYKMEGIYEGKIIEEGYPRNDLTVNSRKEDVITKLNSKGLNIDDSRKIILYAPTWKGAQYGKPEVNIDEYKEFINYIEDNIDMNEYQLLIKPHQIVYREMLKQGVLDKSVYVPATVDTNELLSIVDIMVSDYSSIFYDFMVTGRTILFYIPDLESYKQYRGLYFKTDELPGPCTDKLSDIADWINHKAETDNKYRKKYAEVKKWTCANDDGKAAGRVADIIFNKNEEGYKIVKTNNDKIKILLHQGDFHANGITTSMINLLNSIDYEKYDVTAVMTVKDNIHRDNVMKINDNARVLVRDIKYTATFMEQVRLILLSYLGYKGIGKLVCPKKFFEREFVRCFGNSKFDYIIDFNGYGWMYSYLYLNNKDSKKLIWLHNDMLAERMQKPNGDILLKNIADLYKYHDRVVSCSKSVMEVNRSNLATKEDAEKYTFAKNTINYNKVLEGAKESKAEKDIEYYVNEFESEHSMEKIPCLDSEKINFLNIGRMRKEKNQINLIKAFARLRQENENVMLYILGDGELYDEIIRTIEELDVSDSVVVTGNVSNPFGIMKDCDCFVLPSYHEGQPMVILEARCLKKPVIMSDFSTASECKLENGQYVTGTSEDAIYTGLKAYVDGEVPCDYEFDPKEYNKEAYMEFDRVLTECSIN